MIARHTGWSWREILELPATFLAAWVKHTNRHPTGDGHSHLLLARLTQLVQAMGLGFSGDKGRRVTQIGELAPWLISPEERQEAYNQKKKQNEQLQDARDQAVIYDMKKVAQMMAKQDWTLQTHGPQ